MTLRRIFSIPALVLILTGCGDEGLSTLKREPVAEIELPLAVEVRSFEQGAGTTLGKPSSAVLRRTFVPQGPENLPDLLADAVAQAEGSDWALQPGNSDDYFSASKETDNGTVELAVYVSNGEVVIVNLELRP